MLIPGGHPGMPHGGPQPLDQGGSGAAVRGHGRGDGCRAGMGTQSRSPLPELVVAGDPTQLLARLPAVPAEGVPGADGGPEGTGSPQWHSPKVVFILLLLPANFGAGAGCGDGHQGRHAATFLTRDSAEGAFAGTQEDVGTIHAALRAGCCSRQERRCRGWPAQPWRRA